MEEIFKSALKDLTILSDQIQKYNDSTNVFCDKQSIQLRTLFLTLEELIKLFKKQSDSQRGSYRTTSKTSKYAFLIQAGIQNEQEQIEFMSFFQNYIKQTIALVDVLFQISKQENVYQNKTLKLQRMRFKYWLLQVISRLNKITLVTLKLYPKLRDGTFDQSILEKIFLFKLALQSLSPKQQFTYHQSRKGHEFENIVLNLFQTGGTKTMTLKEISELGKQVKDQIEVEISKVLKEFQFSPSFFINFASIKSVWNKFFPNQYLIQYESFFEILQKNKDDLMVSQTLIELLKQVIEKNDQVINLEAIINFTDFLKTPEFQTNFYLSSFCENKFQYIMEYQRFKLEQVKGEKEEMYIIFKQLMNKQSNQALNFINSELIFNQFLNKDSSYSDLSQLQIQLFKQNKQLGHYQQEIQQEIREITEHLNIGKKYFDIYQMIENISVDGFKREKYVQKLNDFKEEILAAQLLLSEEEDQIEIAIDREPDSVAKSMERITQLLLKIGTLESNKSKLQNKLQDKDKKWIENDQIFKLRRSNVLQIFRQSLYFNLDALKYLKFLSLLIQNQSEEYKKILDRVKEKQNEDRQKIFKYVQQSQLLIDELKGSLQEYESTLADIQEKNFISEEKQIILEQKIEEQTEVYELKLNADELQRQNNKQETKISQLKGIQDQNKRIYGSPQRRSPPKTAQTRQESTPPSMNLTLKTNSPLKLFQQISQYSQIVPNLNVEPAETDQSPILRIDRVDKSGSKQFQITDSGKRSSSKSSTRK